MVTETSHWDPNWLMGSQQYFRLCVRPALDQALVALAADPRRVYSIECVFFLERYWEHRPQRRAQIRDLVNEGRLRLTGSGVTTPDTLLPEDEMLLRDMLAGQEWLRGNGMLQEPRVMYLPDSFGHTPGLPALCRAAGFDYAAVCRIAGMRFPGADLESADRFPRPGTAAAQLTAEGSADFVWRSADGSEVLAHWMSHGYGHGDMIASGGLSRALGLPASWPDRRPANVDRRVERYLCDLRPLARTPYRLLGIGYDFVRPVRDLCGVLSGWNERHHKDSGVWLVNAGMDDYFDLVSSHRDVLPSIELDPNPYWMGFYASRPEIKSGVRELGRRIIVNDVARSTAMIATGAPEQPDRVLARSRWIAVASNHHDFVTGTAPDRVARGEQARWLHEAISATPWPTDPDTAPTEPEQGSVVAPHLDSDLTTIRVQLEWGTATFAPHLGGALVSLKGADGEEPLSGASLVLNSYADSGGLWRMGKEINGGRWSMLGSTYDRPATVDTEVLDSTATVTVRAELEGREVVLRHSFDPHDRVITTTVSPRARLRRTVTLVVATSPAGRVTMHQPGGLVDRPTKRWYDPTYWPLHTFAVIATTDSEASARCFAVASAAPSALHVSDDGPVEVVVARTAIKELAFGVVPVMAPAWGIRFDDQSARLAFGWSNELDDAPCTRFARNLTRILDRAAGWPEVAAPIVVEDPELDVIAVKPAERGEGIIVRLRDWSPTSEGRRVLLALDDRLDAGLVEAWAVDARERDLEKLDVRGGRVEVALRGHLNSVRVTTRRSCLRD